MLLKSMSPSHCVWELDTICYLLSGDLQHTRCLRVEPLPTHTVAQKSKHSLNNANQSYQKKAGEMLLPFMTPSLGSMSLPQALITSLVQTWDRSS